MTYSTQLFVASGTGRLARRPSALLFLPDPSAPDPSAPDPSAPESQAAGVDELVSLFLAAPADALADQIAGFVLDRTDPAPSFVYIAWPSGTDTERITIFVRSDGALTSDIDSVPQLTGSGSSTWVEHRVHRNPATAVLAGGSAASSSTNLDSGVVPAGGFELRLESAHDRHSVTPAAAAAAAASAAPALAPPADGDADAEATITVDDLAAGNSTDITDITDVDDIDADDNPGESTPQIDGLAALAAASGGDWMEDSLQLDSRDPTGPPAASPAASPVAAPAPASKQRETADPSPRSQPSAAPAVDAPGPGAPAYPGDTPSAPTDPTRDAGDSIRRREPGASGERVTRARLCRDGHPNSPHAETCRICEVAIDVGHATITVDQPVLGAVTLPDGSIVPISGDIVIGRNPSANAAQSENGALVAIDAPATVSRTHLKVSVDGWRLLVTDCGSSAGSALVLAGEAEPIPLTAWLAHEVNGGDQIYLGGPTALTVDETTGP